MDLLERARALAACQVFGDLAPAVIVRLAERAFTSELVAGERKSTADTVWVVAAGRLAVASGAMEISDATASSIRRRGSTATPGHVLGVVRVIAPQTKPVEAIAEKASTVIGLAVDDVRDVLEEDPTALASLCDALSRILLDEAR